MFFSIREGSQIFLSLVVGLLPALMLSPVHALESNAITSARDVVTLVSDVDVVQPGQGFHLGLRFRLTPGWHIYWSNPGDAGQAPAMDVVLPDGIKASPIDWPTPVRIAEGPAMVFAYQGEVTLPVTVTVPLTLQTTTFAVDVNANWLICSDHCVPEKGVFHLSLPTGIAKPSAETGLFAASAARQAHPASFPVYIINQALVVADKNLTPQTVSDAWFFPYLWGAIDHAAPQKLTFNDNGLALALQPGQTFDPKAKLAGVLVLKNNQGQENYYSITAMPTESATASGAPSSLGLILLFALVGGFILNLMPCVFPILAMKALSIIKLSGAERHVVRVQAIFYTLGILVAFAVLDGLLLAFQTAGMAVGWGFQFQSPVFVMVIAWLLFALGLNLSGAYEIGGRVMGVGEKHTRRRGVVGSFFTGLLVVVAATPCVAPFIGAAVVAALAAPPVMMLGIFLAMGVGLALPYILLALFPQCVRILPRPGRWMEIFRQALAFPMYGASVWLVWVLSQQVGADGVAMALTGIVMLGFVVWMLGLINTSTSMYASRIGFIFIALAWFFMLGFLFQVRTLQPMSAARVAATGFHEEPYSAARLAELRAQGKAVFVDMTAAWCITCLVNEKMAIATNAVKEAFARYHITYLIGDWTQQKPEITEFLHAHDHDGVPLYVFYPSGVGAESVVLPQILTPSIILDAITPH